MKGFNQDDINEVRRRAGILEVVSETVVLKRAGNQYKGLCPFHKEKGASFYVTPDKGIFKCFGCNEGGDVFAFVQKSKNIDFVESMKLLADRYGVPLVHSSEDRAEYDKRAQILMLYAQSSEYFIRIMEDPTQGLIARKYLEDRRISPDIIERFKLGYAPDGWDGLLNYLVEKTKVSPQTLEEAGLVRRRQETSGHYDLFRNRLMIPICDSEGRVIAFGGRTLGDDKAKYVNSPESPIYTKGQHLFGFNLAKNAIKERDAVTVVEGYFDAITSHQYGFTNTVASLGTALTEQQSKLVVRYTESKRVYLCFDADAAGMKATESGAERLTQIAEGVGIQLRVIKVPGGKDPDECLRSGPEGQAAFQKAIDSAVLLLDYQLDRAISGIDLDTSSGRIEAAGRVVPILAQIKNSVARNEYVRQWAMQLRGREEALLADISQYRVANRLDAPRGFQNGGGFQNNGYQNNGGYQNRYQNNGGYRNQGGGYQNSGYQKNSSYNSQTGRNQGQGYGQASDQGPVTSSPALKPKSAESPDFDDDVRFYDDGSDDGGFGSRGPTGKGLGGDDFKDEGKPMPLPGGQSSPPDGAQSAPNRGFQNRNQGFNQGGGPGQFGNQGQFNGPGGGQFNGPGGGPGGQFGGKPPFKKGGNGKFAGKGDWKGKPKKPENFDEEGLPMPPGVNSHRRPPISGALDAERNQLALYLTSIEDYQKAAQVLAADQMLNDVHQRIKEAIEDVDSNFGPIENLQAQVQNRLLSDGEAARAFIDVIEKAEDIRKQKLSAVVVLLESRARILKERLALLKTEYSSLMNRTSDDSEAAALQGRIKELNQLDPVVLKIETFDDVEKVKETLDIIESAHDKATKMETRV